MLRKLLACGVLAILVPCQAPADPLAPLPPGLSCQQLKDLCAHKTADEIYDMAFFGPGGGPPTGLGVCYVHDKQTCPNCAFEHYVKQSWRSDQKGYDGGTGAVGYPLHLSPEDSRAAAAALLKNLCESGQCCCPVVEPVPCPLGGSPVTAIDPTSGSRCTFPNRCSVPVDWYWQTAGVP
jgi:hypothetical protein